MNLNQIFFFLSNDGIRSARTSIGKFKKKKENNDGIRSASTSIDNLNFSSKKKKKKPVILHSMKELFSIRKAHTHTMFMSICDDKV